MVRDRYVLLQRIIHYSDPDEEDSFTIKKGKHQKPVWYKKMLPFTDEIRSN